VRVQSLDETGFPQFVGLKENVANELDAVHATLGDQSVKRGDIVDRMSEPKLNAILDRLQEIQDKLNSHGNRHALPIQ